MNPPARARGKPLRTYGKRSASVPEDQSEAPSKKRRTSTADTRSQSATPRTQQPDASTVAAVAPSKQQDGTKSIASPGIKAPVAIKKGSILNYFKPLPSPSPITSSSPNSDEVRPTSTPPSSPPTVQPRARRKPRILRFRGTSLPRMGSQESDHEREGDSRTVQSDDEGERRSPRRPLKDESESVLNQLPTNDATVDTQKKKLSRSKSAPTIQTTLNISSQAAFSECKVCNTVWNPLHPDDVKYHMKQHASVLRAKRKDKENEL